VRYNGWDWWRGRAPRHCWQRLADALCLATPAPSEGSLMIIAASGDVVALLEAFLNLDSADSFSRER